MATEPVVIITGTSNCVDTLETFLTYHRRLGVDAFYITECGSVDGTRDVLGSARWRGVVFVVDRPSAVFSEFDPSNAMLEQATREAGPGWSLFCDPDEFWRLPEASFREHFAALDDQGLNLAVLPRANMTARRSAVESGALEQDPFGQLRYRIVRSTKRTAEARGEDRLVPPWIFTRVGSKVALRRELGASIVGGDHDATLRVPVRKEESGRLHALHVPIRGYDSFEAKVRTARSDLGQDPTLSERYAWHWRRWIRLADAGALYQEYLEQFLDDAEIDELVRQGVITDEAGWAGDCASCT